MTYAACCLIQSKTITAHHGLSPTTSINNQENVPQTCPQANLMGTFSQCNSSSEMTVACVKPIETKQQMTSQFSGYIPHTYHAYTYANTHTNAHYKHTHAHVTLTGTHAHSHRQNLYRHTQIKHIYRHTYHTYIHTHYTHTHGQW